MSTMKERPILFNSEMVRAILDGRKTQTCRPIKHEPHPENPYWETKNGLVVAAKQPWHVGDRLWVKETWQEFFDDEIPSNRPRGPFGTMGSPATPERKSRVFYRADGEIHHLEFGKAKWRPSVHMPRWASRITLEVTGLRAEQVQDIGYGPGWQVIRRVEAEGVSCPSFDRGPYCTMCSGHQAPCHIDEFRKLWESIYGNWHANPRVWVTELKVVEVKA